MRPVRAVGLGGLTVGFLDLLDAVVFFGLRGIPPIRVNGVLIHIFGVGLPAALFARAAQPGGGVAR